MLFLPVKVTVGAAGEHGTLYDSGIGVFGRKLEALGMAAGDMSEPLGVIGASLHRNVVGAFATQGAWNGFGGWAALSPAYGAWKEARVPGTPTLVGIKRTGPKGQRPQSYAQSGRMRDEMTDPLLFRVTPRNMLYAPEGDYYGYHLTGTDKMPARPQIELGLETLRSWDRAFVVWLNDLVRRFGL